MVSLISATYRPLKASQGAAKDSSLKTPRMPYGCLETWLVVRPIWGHLGAILWPSRAILGAWPSWGPLGPAWSHLGQTREETDKKEIDREETDKKETDREEPDREETDTDETDRDETNKEEPHREKTANVGQLFTNNVRFGGMDALIPKPFSSSRYGPQLLIFFAV